MFFEGVCSVGYAPLIVCTLKVMPSLRADDSITGSILVSTSRPSARRKTLWQALAEQVPLPFVSYFEPFIAAFAFARLPRSPGVLYGANSASWLLKSVSGTMWLATLPIVGPPHACTSACLSMIQFIALRTWMSSKGGWVMFIVRYHVRSPELECRLELCCRAYLRSVCDGMLETSSWNSPAATLFRMSSAFASTRKSNSSGRFSRAAVESVFAL